VSVTHSPQFIRSHVLQLQRVEHGSVAAAELARFGRTPADVLDFSVNINPLGPAPAVLRALQETDWTRYPGDDENPLREGLAQRNGVIPAQVALGNGSAELLWLIALSILQPQDRVVVVGPTFGEYARAARTTGANVREVQALRDLPPARMLFVCNPNNPTGYLHERSEILQVLSAQPDRLVVLDEAYAVFLPDRWQSEAVLAAHPNLVLLRSLTKEHALPGLRLGYLLAAPEVACAVESVRPPWSVNAGALRAGLATLESEAETHVEHARAIVAASRELLTDGFNQLGYHVRPSAANFVLVEVGDAGIFRRTLLRHGFVVRDCTSFGLPSYVRVACRVPEECEALIDTVRGLKDAGELPACGES
jgi:histidinol-phosphate aminotransferase